MMLQAEKITSRKSPVVRDAASLLQKAEKRSEAGLFMAEGARLCADAAKSHTGIAVCFYTEAAQKKYAAYLEPVLKVAEKAYCVEEHIAPLLSDTKNPQGIFCVCRMPAQKRNDTADDRHILVLENVQDPNNMGNILRTAEALGIRRIALVDACCDIYGPKVLRGSMGAVFRIASEQYENAAACLDALNGRGYTSLASVPDSTAVPITHISFTSGKWAAWIGNEGNGMTEYAIENCAEKITIPMLGRAESFNASTAAAIIMWEMMRGESREANVRG